MTRFACRLRRAVYLLAPVFAACTAAAAPEAFPQALGGLMHGGGTPPEMPRNLLSAPVNLMWAANHAGHWRMLGVDGFLIHGVVNGLDEAADRLNPPPDESEEGAAEDPLPPAPDGAGDAESHESPGAPDHDALLHEVRFGQQRLAEAGIPENYLLLTLAPETGWFSDPAWLRRGVTALRNAGNFARAAGLRGVALDTASDSFIHDYRWDAYAGITPARLREGARTFGRRGLRALYREHPEAEVLVIADDPIAAGALWFSLLQGMLESFGAADALRLHLLPRAIMRADGPAELAEQTAALERLLAGRLPPEALAVWRAQGALAIGLPPLTREASGAPAAPMDPAGFAQLRGMARLLARDFVWTESKTQDYWRARPEEGPSYTHLRILGDAPAAQTLEMHPLVEAYGFADPLDGWTRGGWREEAGALAHVLWNETEAALAGFADSVPEGIEAGPWPIAPAIEPAPDQRDPGAVWFAPGLPRVPWVARAGLELLPGAPLHADLRRTPVSLAFTNHFDAPVRGSLQVVPPVAYSLGAAIFPLNAAPGSRANQSRTLQGVFSPGATEAFTLNLLQPEAARPSGGGEPNARELPPVISQEFRFHVAPALQFNASLNGPILGAPLPLAGGDFAVAGERGTLARIGPDGALRWERHWPVRFVLPPALGEAQTAEGNAVQAIGCLDHRGRFRVLGEDGRLRFQWQLPQREGYAGIAHQAARPEEGVDEGAWIVAHASGEVIAVTEARILAWRLGLADAVRWVAHGNGHTWLYTERDASDPEFARDEESEAAIEAAILSVDERGAVRWRTPMEGRLALAPLAVDAASSALLIAESNGALRLIDGVNGHERARGALPNGAAHAIAAGGAPGGPLYFAALSGGEAVLLDGGLRPLFQHETAGMTAVTVALIERAPFLLTVDETGGLHLYGAEGKMPWRELRAAAPLAAPPLAGDFTGGGVILCVYGALDGCVRGVTLGFARPGAQPLTPRETVVQ